jgi:hypothetical protein
MTQQALLDDYTALSSTNTFYTRNRARWEYLYNSYAGGDDYRQGAYLTQYTLETANEYQARLNNCPLDNHCQSVIQTYISFLFREEPEREFYDWAGLADVEAFLKDADMENRSLDAFMKQVSTWISVFGHGFIIMTKPNLGAVSLGQELAMGVRPYVNFISPLVASDWTWEREPGGKYVMTYFKYVEDVADGITTVREWTPESIKTWIMDDVKKEAYLKAEEPNMLGLIPVIMVYNQRGIVRDQGISDITDIADLQRQIYNLQSENEQSIRMDGHPSLVVPATAQLGSGAGALIVLQEGADPGQNPYYLESGGTGVANIHSSIDKLVEAIDRISFTGGVRGTVSKTMSGIAMATEFELLNAKLSEKADQLELAEENIWRLFGLYQNRVWNGEVEYPGSFNIRDQQREFSELATAKSAATSPEALAVIDFRVRELLEDPTLTYVPEPPEVESEGEEEAVMPVQGAQEHPVTTPETRQAHIQTMLMEGYTNDQILALHPEITLDDIIAAGAAAAANN